MNIVYKMNIKSAVKEIDGLPMELVVGSKLDCFVSNVQPLCNNAVKGSDEEVWKLFYPNLRFILVMSVHDYPDWELKCAPEE